MLTTSLRRLPVVLLLSTAIVHSQELRRPKLVVTDTGGRVTTLQPGPGHNNGTDDGSANAGKDTGAYGPCGATDSPTRNFAADTFYYLMTSTCNSCTGYGYLQFSLSGMPTQNIASAKVQIYMTSQVVAGLSPLSANPNIALRRVTSAWDETRLSWASGQPTFDATAVDTQALPGVAGNRNTVSGWLTFDITALYKGWAGGTIANYGVRFSHENGQCLNGWAGTVYTSNDMYGVPACAYSISPATSQISAAGASVQVGVTATSSSCSWTAASNGASWITINSGASGSGNGTVTFTVAANASTASRTGTLTIAGATHTVTQAAAPVCTYSITPVSASIPAAGGNGTVTVTSATGCGWTATSSASWITISAGASGSGGGTVQYTVAANTATSSRSATLTIAGQTHTVTQAAAAVSCTYAITPATESIPAAGGNGTVTVTAAAGCAWKATSPVAWITIAASGASGTGNGTVPYTVAANTASTSRTATLTIAGLSHAVTQAAAPAAGTPVITSILNWDDGLGWLTPGSRIAIYGSSLAAVTDYVSDLPAPTEMDRVTVEVTDGDLVSNAAITMVSPTEVDAVLGLNLTGPQVQVRVLSGGVASATFAVTLQGRSPHILTDNQVDAPGNATAVHGDGSYVTSDSPAQAGEWIWVFTMGLGNVFPLPDPGTAAGDGSSEDSPFNEVTAPVTATVGGLNADVQMAALGWLSFYYVGLHVPDGLTSGTYELQLNIGDAASQPKVTLPVSSPWRLGQSAVVGSNGATLTAPGLTVAIGQGAVSSLPAISVYSHNTFDPSTTSDIVSGMYRIDGLPSDLGTGVTISIDPKTALPDGDIFLVLKRGGDAEDGPTLFPAQVRNGRIVAQLNGFPTPDSGGVSTTGNESARTPQAADPASLASSSKVSWMLWMTAGLRPNTSSNGHFIIHMPAGYPAILAELDKSVENAYTLIAGLGLDWSRRNTSNPIEVYVFSYSSWGNTVLGGTGNANGNEESEFWSKGNIGLCINLDPIASGNASALEETRITAGHELLHVMQSNYDPRTYFVTFRYSPWYWMDEATAVWFERVLAVNPDYTSGLALTNLNFPLKGGMDQMVTWGFLGIEATKNHGYGASSFLQMLAPASSGVPDTRIGDILKLMAVQSAIGITASSEYSGTQALSMVFPDMEKQWKVYCQKWVQGQVNGSTNLPRDVDRWTTWPEKVRFTGNTATLRFTATELSAHYYRMDFPVSLTWPAGTKLQLKVTGPAGGATAYFFQRDKTAKDLALYATVEDTAVGTLDNADRLMNSSLYILLVNSGSSYNYRKSSEVVLTMSVANSTDPGNPTGPPLYNPLFSSFVLDAACVWSGTSEDCSISYDNYSPGDPAITWKGNHFDAVYNYTGTRVTHEFTMGGDLNTDRSRLVKVTFTDTMTSKGTGFEDDITQKSSGTINNLLPDTSAAWSDKPTTRVFTTGSGSTCDLSINRTHNGTRTYTNNMTAGACSVKVRLGATP